MTSLQNGREIKTCELLNGHRARQDNQDGYDPSNIALLLIDTRSTPDGVFVKDLDLIDAFATYSDPMLKKSLSYLQQLRQGPRGYCFG